MRCRAAWPLRCAVARGHGTRAERPDGTCNPARSDARDRSDKGRRRREGCRNDLCVVCSCSPSSPVLELRRANCIKSERPAFGAPGEGVQQRVAREGSRGACAAARQSIPALSVATTVTAGGGSAPRSHPPTTCTAGRSRSRHVGTTQPQTSPPHTVGRRARRRPTRHHHAPQGRRDPHGIAGPARPPGAVQRRDRARGGGEWRDRGVPVRQRAARGILAPFGRDALWRTACHYTPLRRGAAPPQPAADGAAALPQLAALHPRPGYPCAPHRTALRRAAPCTPRTCVQTFACVPR